MFNPTATYAIYMEGNLDSDYGKMGFGIMRYASNPICCVIDSKYAGSTVKEAVDQPYNFPVVSSIQEAHQMGAEVLVLGIAPSGGKYPEAWDAPISQGLEMGMSLINGLHDRLNDRYGHLLDSTNKEQYIWDVRIPMADPPIATARAADLKNKRVLLVGTDMAIGKMTAGLELYRWVQEQKISTAFLATGQIGITITGKGIPLDAIKVDKACGAVEELVMSEADKDILFVEGQGSLLHPGSTATLPLMRGSCPTHLVLCHKAYKTHLRKPKHIQVPKLSAFIKLNESLASVCGSLPKARTIGVALNTYGLSQEQALNEIAHYERETGLPVTDVIRFGPEKLGLELLDH